MKFEKYRKLKCQYCCKETTVVSGNKLYPAGHRLSLKEFYYCSDCDAWVGMHLESKKPFGSVAKKDLRLKRKMAHDAFDEIWKNNIFNMTRKEAYSWLSKKMNMSNNKCHIGAFNIEQCNSVIIFCIDYKKSLYNGL